MGRMKFKGSGSIDDPQAVALLSSLELDMNALTDEHVNTAFLNKYINWIKSSKGNNTVGLENFTASAYSNGTTEAFDKFYIRNHGRRMRCLRGEYLYHTNSWDTNNISWAYIDDVPLEANDAVVISLPFANTGNNHYMYHVLMEECERSNIPVLVDCSYFGVCSGITFNFAYKCITDIAFSLSKVFPVSRLRIGMRLTRTDLDDGIQAYNNIGYTNRLGAHIGLQFLTNFTADYIPTTYQLQQLEFCRHLGVAQSNTVIYGVSTTHPEYNRGGETDRLSFHKYLATPDKFYEQD